MVVITFVEPVPVTVAFDMNFGGTAALAYVTVPATEFAGGVPPTVAVAVGVAVAVAVAVAVFVAVGVAPQGLVVDELRGTGGVTTSKSALLSLVS